MKSVMEKSCCSTTLRLTVATLDTSWIKRAAPLAAHSQSCATANGALLPPSNQKGCNRLIWDRLLPFYVKMAISAIVFCMQQEFNASFPAYRFRVFCFVETLRRTDCEAGTHTGLISLTLNSEGLYVSLLGY